MPPNQVCAVFYKMDEYFGNITVQIRKELLLECRRRTHDLHLEGGVAQLAENGPEKGYKS